MDKLRELVTDFRTKHDQLTREEIEAARTLLRHARRHSGDAAT
ncbi:hypothetical protein ACIQCD_27405 [Streptomyces sp. NPDC093250]